MCGIAGIVHFNNTVARDQALRMRDIMSHRGPDDSGIYVWENVCLVHRRLSIIDISGGRQPMCNEDGTIWITFNGEIYNYRELTKDLEEKGHVFRTKSDTEVILHLYEEDGIECVKKFNGMFAFAIWDESRRRLFVARDRLGVKPLYYCLTKEAFLFASEIKAILESKAIRAECNKERIQEYLLFRFVAGEETLFKKIFNLLPGHVLVLEGNNLKITQYWTLNGGPLPDRVHLDEYVENLSDLLSDSIRLRLRSDVPLGTFCSGGVDSSLVTALAASSCNPSLNTFCVGFNEKEFDERSIARLVSRQYHTNHHELVIRNHQFAEALPRVIWFNDEPLNHPNSIPLFLISQYARNFVTVILTGEGADELLGGYPRYFIPLVALRYRNLPVAVRTLIIYFLQSYNDPRAKKLREALCLPMHEVAISNSSVADKYLVKKVLANDIGENSFCRVFDWEEGGRNKTDLFEDFFERFFLLELNTYLVSILNRQDKTTMAAGIESRVPFLDYRLVEFCFSISYRLKLKGSRSKYLLKKLAEKYLPHEVVYRKKSGFGVPISSWLRDPKGMGRYLDLLHSSRFKQRGYFHQYHVDRIISDHLAGKEDHSELLWALLNLELWHQLFIDTSAC